MKEKSITKFLSEEYKEFAMYSIEGRAIPSVVDGFKPSQRKIIHISSQIWKTGNEKPIKIFQLAGKVASDAFYHHGNSSLEGSIINMAQKFKNSAALLEEDGQFGSLRSPQAGAARYIGTKLGPNFRLMYKDFELLNYKEEEGESIEPYFFLPIIPTVLLNGSPGIAVGFASIILNREIKTIIDSCLRVLSNKKVLPLKPHFNEFNGEFIQDEDNIKKWTMRGIFKRANTSTVIVTDLPPSMTYEKYEKLLDSLVEKKDIVSYDDNCKDDVNYTIKFQRAVLEKLDDAQIIKLLKLEENVTEIFTTLDENGKLKIFDCAEDIVTYFVNFRLNYYFKRKEFILSKLQRDLKILSNRGRFIKAILDGKLTINNVSKADIIIGIESLSLEKVDDSYDYLLRMPIYSLTKELFEKLKEDFVSKKQEIKDLELVDPSSMYVDDLNELKKKFK